MDMRGLTHFIRDVKDATTNSKKERERIELELFKIRSQFMDTTNMNMYQRRKYVCKLMFIAMLGYSVEFGHMEGLYLLASSDPPDKLVGYLSLMVLLHSGHSILTLATSSIQKDLNSGRVFENHLALSAIANVGSFNFFSEISHDVRRYIEDPSMNLNLTKKAILTYLRLYRSGLLSSDIEHILPKILLFLDHSDLSLVGTVITFLTNIVNDIRLNLLHLTLPNSGESVIIGLENENGSSDMIFITESEGYDGQNSHFLSVKKDVFLQKEKESSHAIANRSQVPNDFKGIFMSTENSENHISQNSSMLNSTSTNIQFPSILSQDGYLFKNIFPSCIQLLKLITRNQINSTYLFYGIPAPFLQVKILRLLQLFPCPVKISSEVIKYDFKSNLLADISEACSIKYLDEDNSSELGKESNFSSFRIIIEHILRTGYKILSEVTIAEHLKGSQNRINSTVAILCECISLCILWNFGPTLLDFCLDIIIIMISNKKDQNQCLAGLRLLNRFFYNDRSHGFTHESWESASRVEASEDALATDRFQELIPTLIFFLHVDDQSLRLASLDALCIICEFVPSTFTTHVQTALLHSLLSDDDLFNTTLVLRITLLCERIYTDAHLYVDMMLNVALQTRSELVPDVVICRIQQVIIQNYDIHKYATRKFCQALFSSEPLPAFFVKLAAFLLGEFGFQIALEPDFVSIKQVQGLGHQLSLISEEAKSFVLSTLFKLYCYYEEKRVTKCIISYFESYSHHESMELQQRSMEYLYLIQKFNRRSLKSLIAPFSLFYDIHFQTSLCTPFSNSSIAVPDGKHDCKSDNLSVIDRHILFSCLKNSRDLLFEEGNSSIVSDNIDTLFKGLNSNEILNASLLFSYLSSGDVLSSLLYDRKCISTGFSIWSDISKYHDVHYYVSHSPFKVGIKNQDIINLYLLVTNGASFLHESISNVLSSKKVISDSSFNSYDLFSELNGNISSADKGSKRICKTKTSFSSSRKIFLATMFKWISSIGLNDLNDSKENTDENTIKKTLRVGKIDDNIENLPSSSSCEGNSLPDPRKLMDEKEYALDSELFTLEPKSVEEKDSLLASLVDEVAKTYSIDKIIAAEKKVITSQLLFYRAWSSTKETLLINNNQFLLFYKQKYHQADGRVFFRFSYSECQQKTYESNDSNSIKPDSVSHKGYQREAETPPKRILFYIGLSRVPYSLLTQCRVKTTDRGTFDASPKELVRSPIRDECVFILPENDSVVVELACRCLGPYEGVPCMRIEFFLLDDSKLRDMNKSSSNDSFTFRNKISANDNKSSSGTSMLQIALPIPVSCFLSPLISNSKGEFEELWTKLLSAKSESKNFDHWEFMTPINHSDEALTNGCFKGFRDPNSMLYSESVESKGSDHANDLNCYDVGSLSSRPEIFVSALSSGAVVKGLLSDSASKDKLATTSFQDKAKGAIPSFFPQNNFTERLEVFLHEKLNFHTLKSEKESSVILGSASYACYLENQREVTPILIRAEISESSNHNSRNLRPQNSLKCSIVCYSEKLSRCVWALLRGIIGNSDEFLRDSYLITV